VASFRTRSDGLQGDCVWLLHRQERYALDLDEYEFDPNALRLQVLLVDEYGSIRPYRTHSSASEAGEALLVEWVLQEKGKRLHGVRRLMVRKDDEEWESA